MTTISTRVDAWPRASRRRRGLNRLLLVAFATDFVIITLATLIALSGRQQLDFFDPASGVQESLRVAGPLIVVAWLLAILLMRGYRQESFGSGAEEFKSLFQASVLTGGLIGVGCYVLKFQLSRGFFLLLFAIGIPALLVGRIVLRRALHSLRRRGHLTRRVIIAGGSRQIDEVASVLQRELWLGYRVVGALTPPEDLREETPAGVPILGNIDDLALVVPQDIDTVFFAGGTTMAAADTRTMLWDLERHQAHLVIAPALSEISGERVTMRPVGGLPLMHVDPPTWSDASRIGKRTFDLVGAALALVLLSPVFLAAWVAVRLHDRGPVLFRQVRIGRHGEPFQCLKFRTMRPDAHLMVDRMQEELGASAMHFKLKEDPRITAPGRWLRRFSIDELPQLLNVLRGQMSLVGPRPQVAEEVRLYDDAMSRRLHVRPGMTGLWQVSGRSDLSSEEAMRLDLFYVDNWSMWQDTSILLRTIGAVFGSRGAY